MVEGSAGLFLLCALVGFGAGWVDSVAGGGGLVVVPFLLSLGLPAPMALATNKLQGFGGTASATLFYISKGTVRLGPMMPGIVSAAAGAVAGAWVLTSFSSDFAGPLIPVLLLCMTLFFLLYPGIRTGFRWTMPRMMFLCTIPFGLALYDGFFGPGTGMFLALCFICFQGYSMTEATAHAKLFNCISNCAALMYFLFAGSIVWSVGLVMMLGQLMGAQLGSRMVLKRGSRIVRPVVVLASAGMAVKLLLEG